MDVESRAQLLALDVQAELVRAAESSSRSSGQEEDDLLSSSSTASGGLDLDLGGFDLSSPANRVGFGFRVTSPKAAQRHSNHVRDMGPFLSALEHELQEEARLAQDGCDEQDVEPPALRRRDPRPGRVVAGTTASSRLRTMSTGAAEEEKKEEDDNNNDDDDDVEQRRNNGRSTGFRTSSSSSYLQRLGHSISGGLVRAGMQLAAVNGNSLSEDDIDLSRK